MRPEHAVAAMMAAIVGGLIVAMVGVHWVMRVKQAAPTVREVAMIVVAAGVTVLFVLLLLWPSPAPAPAAPRGPTVTPTTYGPPPMYVGEVPQ
jgi:hypothetical protein